MIKSVSWKDYKFNTYNEQSLKTFSSYLNFVEWAIHIYYSMNKNTNTAIQYVMNRIYPINSIQFNYENIIKGDDGGTIPSGEVIKKILDYSIITSDITSSSMSRKVQSIDVAASEDNEAFRFNKATSGESLDFSFAELNAGQNAIDPALEIIALIILIDLIFTKNHLNIPELTEQSFPEGSKRSVLFYLKGSISRISRDIFENGVDTKRFSDNQEAYLNPDTTNAPSIRAIAIKYLIEVAIGMHRITSFVNKCAKTFDDADSDPCQTAIDEVNGQSVDHFRRSISHFYAMTSVMLGMSVKKSTTGYATYIRNSKKSYYLPFRSIGTNVYKYMEISFGDDNQCDQQTIDGVSLDGFYKQSNALPRLFCPRGAASAYQLHPAAIKAISKGYPAYEVAPDNSIQTTGSSKIYRFSDIMPHNISTLFPTYRIKANVKDPNTFFDKYTLKYWDISFPKLKEIIDERVVSSIKNGRAQDIKGFPPISYPLGGYGTDISNSFLITPSGYIWTGKLQTDGLFAWEQDVGNKDWEKCIRYVDSSSATETMVAYKATKRKGWTQWFSDGCYLTNTDSANREMAKIIVLSDDIFGKLYAPDVPVRKDNNMHGNCNIFLTGPFSIPYVLIHFRKEATTDTIRYRTISDGCCPILTNKIFKGGSPYAGSLFFNGLITIGEVPIYNQFRYGILREFLKSMKKDLAFLDINPKILHNDVSRFYKLNEKSRIPLQSFDIYWPEWEAAQDAKK